MERKPLFISFNHFLNCNIQNLKKLPFYTEMGQNRNSDLPSLHWQK